MSGRGIPSVSDYAHWNEDAHLMWYQENKYDMENGYDGDYDDLYDDYVYHDEEDYEDGEEE